MDAVKKRAKKIGQEKTGGERIRSRLKKVENKIKKRICPIKKKGIGQQNRAKKSGEK